MIRRLEFHAQGLNTMMTEDIKTTRWARLSMATALPEKPAPLRSRMGSRLLANVARSALKSMVLRRGECAAGRKSRGLQPVRPAQMGSVILIGFHGQEIEAIKLVGELEILEHLFEELHVFIFLARSIRPPM
jgi:hypothetical protein